MGGSQKSKKVSWASDVNLCQVRLFLSEESPSQVGVGIQDHLQAKPWPLQAGAMGSDENLPPGFEGIPPANPWAAKLSQISLVKWKCPPRFEIERSWRVVAGEESREIEIQNQREMGVLEAIYPRPSAIPLNPCASLTVEDSTNSDQHTPVVPITPIEDEDASLDTSYTFTTSNTHSPNPTFSSQTNITPKPNTEADIVAAAQAALSSVMSSSDQGNLIDRELLMKILSNPKMIEQLIANHAASSTPSTFHGMLVMGSESAASSTTQNMQSATVTKNVASSSSATPSTSSHYSPPKSSFDPVNIDLHRRRPEMVAPPISAPFHPPSRPGSILHHRPSMLDSTSVTKDINYYKSLIQQHGGERRETVPQFGHQEPLSNMMMKPRESKPKIMKPCIYFNSSRGCRNGANCSFQHDVASQQKVNNCIPEVQGTKRVKLD